MNLIKFNKFSGVAVVLASVIITSHAQAEQAPLSAVELAQCADQVQTLRAKSARLNQKNAEFEKRRTDIKARSGELNDGAKLSAIDENQKRLRLNTDVLRFNGDIKQFGSDVAALNVVKKNYDARCSGRSYRHSDFASLTPGARAAMQAGLSDVQVPYTQTLKPLATQNAQ